MIENHRFNKSVNPVYAYYNEKHSQFCNEFDSLTEHDEGTKEDYQELCLSILDAFSELCDLSEKNK